MTKSDFISSKLTYLSWRFRKAQFQNSTWIRGNKWNAYKRCYISCQNQALIGLWDSLLLTHHFSWYIVHAGVLQKPSISSALFALIRSKLQQKLWANNVEEQGCKIILSMSMKLDFQIPLFSIGRHLPGQHLEPFQSQLLYISLAHQLRHCGLQGRGG